MTREEIENTPKIVGFLLSESVTAETRMKLHERLEELCKLANKALEQESILDKIRAEISCEIIADDTSGNAPSILRADWETANKAHMIDMAILDKYKAESEDKE